MGKFNETSKKEFITIDNMKLFSIFFLRGSGEMSGEGMVGKAKGEVERGGPK